LRDTPLTRYKKPTAAGSLVTDPAAVGWIVQTYA